MKKEPTLNLDNPSNPFTDFQKINEDDDIFKQMFKYSVIPTIIHDMEMNIINANDCAAEEFGYSQKELLKKSIFDLHTEDELGHSKEVLNEIQQKKKTSVETSFKRKDGSIFFAKVTPCKFLLGVKPVIHVYIQDISERKRTGREFLYQNNEKEKRAAELVIANKELAFQNNEKEKRAAELIIANKELAFQNDEKEKRAAELAVANKELTFQNKLKEKRAAELIIANKELAFQNDEKEKRAAELVIANKELAFQNNEKEKQAAELIITKQTYLDVFNTVSEAIYVQDEKGTFIDINKGAENMYGYTRQELIGKNPLLVSAPNLNDIDEVQKISAKVFKSGVSARFDFWAVRKNGEIFPKEVIINKGRYFGKDVLITTARDITLIKRTEKELIIAKEKAEESTDLYFGLFNNSPIGLYQTTPSGEILSANNTIIKMLKFDSLEDLLQRDLTKGGYLDKNKRNEFKTILEEKGEITDFESEWYTKHGDIITVLEGAKAIKNAKGQIVRYDGAIQDITFKKRIQKELIISKERAEESDKLKSAFLANMSHEIRTPMNGILGFSELLKSPNLSGEKQQKYIEIIEKSGKRMLNIINDIVDISKIEAGLMNVEIKESNINEQIEYIYTFFKPEVEAKRMQLYFKNSLPAEEAIIKTDREKLFAILTNLVKNAIKYTNKGSIEFGYVLKMGAESVDEIQNNELEFFVKDTGIGIQKDRQEAIFERFIQADIKDTMARQGAGLGLSITKAYVEMLGGKIWVESEEGIGSTFYFTLPYNHELKEKINTKDIKVTDNTENRIKNLKILMAEDDETSGMLLSLHLSEFSNKILEARTGRETIEACRNNPDIDLILMDIKMPDLDGYEAIRQIRQFNKDVIIIAQTAYGLSGDREKCLDAGFNDYISKPIKKDHLGALIQKYFK